MAFPALSIRSSSPLAVHHCRQPLPCVRYMARGVSAKTRVLLCLSSFNVNTDSSPGHSVHPSRKLSYSCSYLTALPGCAVNVSLG